ncbi:hypothetical protein ACQ4PT_037549 [Festuca glaucescens]
MADISSAGSSGIGAGEDDGIDDMLKHLELHEDELDDVVLGETAVAEFRKEARWLAIGKVLTTKSFSVEAFFEKMKAVWNLSREPGCREAGKNMFIFQMHCLGDWKKVVHQGPWTFRGCGVFIEDYDGMSDLETVAFTGMYVWAQIHGIPELYRKETVVDDLARKIGKAKEVQMAPKLFYEGNYVRTRVMIDTTKPLMRFVSLSVTGEGRKRLAVKYEKIPFFCKRCGLLGHDYEECGDGVWEEKDLQYGTWMLARRRVSQPVSDSRSFTPRVPQRGGWSGRGGKETIPRKRSSGDAKLDDKDDTKDTVSSLMKITDTGNLKEDDTILARRKLDLAGTVMETKEGYNTTEPNGSSEEVPPPPPLYTDPRERTKLRKVSPNENDLATSAASFEEDRRAQ